MAVNAKHIAEAKKQFLTDVKGWDTDAVESKIEMELKELQTKADEIMYSQNTGAGEELVPQEVTIDTVVDVIDRKTTFISELAPGRQDTAMLSARTDVPIVGQRGRFKQNSEWTTGDYIEAEPSRKMATDRVTIPQVSFEYSVGVSEYLDTYSVSDILNLINNKIAAEAAYDVEDMVLNADNNPAATGNINSDDQAASAGLADGTLDNKFAFGSSIRLSALNGVSGTDFVDIAGTLDIQDIYNALGNFRYDVTPDELVMVMDRATYYKAFASLPEYKDLSVNGVISTVSEGTLFNFQGIPTYISGNLRTTNAAGKIDTLAPANNTQGGIHILKKNVMQHGFGKELETELTRFSIRKGWVFEAVMHFGQQDINKRAGETDPSIVSLINIDL